MTGPSTAMLGMKAYGISDSGWAATARPRTEEKSDQQPTQQSDDRDHDGPQKMLFKPDTDPIADTERRARGRLAVR